MNDLTLFLAGSAAIVWLSRKPLRKPGSHGFYRFFAWEAILGLIVMNREVWGTDPYSPHQFTSWLLMMSSIALVVIGVATLKRDGAPGATRDDGSFYEFEKTTQLVSHGIFGYIRHPMYAGAALLMLGLPLWLGSTTGALAALVPLALLTVRIGIEERFLRGALAGYSAYAARVRSRLIPGVW